MTVHAPNPPPEPTEGIPGPTFVAHDGIVWRRGMKEWFPLFQPTAGRLRDAFRVDAENTEDWFHPRAAELADEIDTALASLKLESQP